jgi:15-hydroxyprostaglandin dehydrogenase (NAD)
MSIILEARKESIQVNCICPGLVKTALPAQELFDLFPQQHQTPMETILRCMHRFINEDLNGKVIECSGRNLNQVDPPDYSDEHSRFLVSRTE